MHLQFCKQRLRGVHRSTFPGSCKLSLAANPFCKQACSRCTGLQTFSECLLSPLRRRLSARFWRFATSHCCSLETEGGPLPQAIVGCCTSCLWARKPSRGALCPWRGDAKPAVLERLPASRIRDGPRSCVSWYHGLLSFDSQVPVCMAQPRFDAVVDREARLLTKHMQLRRVFLNADEVWMGGTCAACADCNMAELSDFARALLYRCSTVIRAGCPGVCLVGHARSVAQCAFELPLGVRRLPGLVERHWPRTCRDSRVGRRTAS